MSLQTALTLAGEELSSVARQTSGALVASITSLGTLALIIFSFYICYAGMKQIREKETMIVQRFGRYHRTLIPGLHFIIPFMDQPKRHSYRYYESDARGNIMTKERTNMTRVSTQNVVIDFPRQNVITRDNASVFLDAVFQYKIDSPVNMIYRTQNLPYMLSKLLQAQIRNVAGELDIDQIIEESHSLNRLSSLMEQEASRWGVKIIFVRVQRVEASGLTEVLAQKKNADLENQEIIIGAKAYRQTAIIEAEGVRDSLVRKAEGEAQEMVARARGQAQAITNAANAEARSVKEIAKIVSKGGENPARYLLSLKYLEALQKIVSTNNTQVDFVPDATAFVQTAQHLGLNTVLPAAGGK